jgi:hypothetical protein
MATQTVHRSHGAFLVLSMSGKGIARSIVTDGDEAACGVERAHATPSKASKPGSIA